MAGVFGGCFPWSWLVDSILCKHLCPRGFFFQKTRDLNTTIVPIPIPIPILPKETVLEILCRLPSTSVIRFRLVCKQWCLLTSTPSFLEMHENNQPTTTPLESALVVQYFDHKVTVPRFQFKTFFINEKATKRNKKFEMVREYIDLTQARDPHEYYLIKLLSSYKGFLLFTATATWPDDESALIVYNPVTKEQVTVTAPPSRYVYCGFFFHSPTKEFRILYQVFHDDADDDYHKDMVARFELLGLQTRSFRKIYVKKKFASKYHPDRSKPTVITNGALHWMVSEAHHKKVFGGAIPSCSETILSFGMESEEFHLMPHPRFRSGRHDCVSLRRTGGHKMDLLEMEGGILCLGDGYRPSELSLFVMKNYEKWTWVLTHVIPFHAYGLLTIDYGLYIKALQIHQGELVVYYNPEPFSYQYLLFSLNQNEPDDASYKFKRFSSRSKYFEEQFDCFDDVRLFLRNKQHNKEKSNFKVVIRQSILKKSEWLDDDQTLRRMIINYPGCTPKDKFEYAPSASVGNMVVFTPSLASLQHHNGNGNGNGNGSGNYILSVQYESHKSTLTEYDVQTRQWRRVLGAGSPSSSQ